MDFYVSWLSKYVSKNQYKLSKNLFSQEIPKKRQEVLSFLHLLILFQNERNPKILFILKGRYSILQVALVPTLAE